MPAGSSTVLLFSELLADTGLLLAVRLPVDAVEVHRVLPWIGQDSFLFPPKIAAAPLTPHELDQELAGRLAELFFYLSGILCPAGTVSLWTWCLRIANFAGCKLDGVGLPVQFPHVSNRDRLRLGCFLLCSFLTLRQKNGKVSARGDATLTEEARVAAYRCEVSLQQDYFLTPISKREPIPSAPLFLSARCFADLVADLANGEMRLQMYMPVQKNVTMVCSQSRYEVVCLQLSLFALAEEILP